MVDNTKPIKPGKKIKVWEHKHLDHSLETVLKIKNDIEALMDENDCGLDQVGYVAVNPLQIYELCLAYSSLYNKLYNEDLTKSGTFSTNNTLN